MTASGLLWILGVAHGAGCVGERPVLTLGERAWFIQDAEWRTPTSRVAVARGFGFSVELDGAPVGVVVSGDLGHTTLARGAEAVSLERSLVRELEYPQVQMPWEVAADVAWGLSAEHVAAWTEPWTEIAPRDRVLLDLEAPVQPSILVVDHADFARARREARQAVADRGVALADAGYPLETLLRTLGVHDGDHWQLIEARTQAPVGRLAGPRIDPWVTSLVDDPVVGTGQGSTTVALGTRYVESLSGG